MKTKTTSIRLSMVAAPWLFLALSQTAHAQFTVLYDFVGGGASALTTGSQASSVNAVDFTPVGSGAGISSSENAFLRSVSTGDDEASALNNLNYLSFTVSAANSGEFLNLSSLTFDLGGTTGTTVPNPGFTTNIVVQSSVGGFGAGNPTITATPSSFDVPDDSTSFTSTSVNISLTGAEFQGLSSITFQLRFFDDINSTTAIDRIDNVELSGAIVPEPASVALYIGLGVLGLVAYRRRR